MKKAIVIIGLAIAYILTRRKPHYGDEIEY